jgi:predicted Zn-dependent protease
MRSRNIWHHDHDIALAFVAGLREMMENTMADQAVIRSRLKVIALACVLLAGGMLAKPSLAQTKSPLRLYFVAIGDVPRELLDHLIVNFQSRFGLALTILMPMTLAEAAFDPQRRQMVAEEVISSMRRRHLKLARDPQARVIGITPLDMYMQAKRDEWRFSFSVRSPDRRFAIVSYARMDPAHLGDPPSEDQLRSRLRKMITKNIGIMYYGLPASPNPRSVMFRDILGVDDLDRMTEDFNPK